MTAMAPISCNRWPPNMTTGSRESGANLSTRCSGTFAEDGSGGSSRSSSVNPRELPGDLHDALGLLAARRASEYPSLVSEVPEIVIRIRAFC